MEERLMEELDEDKYDSDNIAQFLGLTPEQEKRIMSMILRARLEWMLEN